MRRSNQKDVFQYSITEPKSVVRKEFILKIPPTRGSAEIKKIISLGQFRPEKDHPLQIKETLST